jgi:hypothetical protein
VWTEPAVGAEARSLRRWGQRVLPARIARAGLVLLLGFVFMVALGRTFEPQWMCGYPSSFGSARTECPPPGPRDLWDAVF